MVNKADEQLELEANETLPLQLRASMAAHYPPPAPSSGGGVPGVTSSSLPGVAGACMGAIGAMGVRVGGVGQSTLTKPLPPLPSIASLPRHQHSLSGQHPHGSGSSRGSPPKQPQQHIYQDSQLGMMDGMGEYAEAGGPGGLSGHPHHPSMSSAMNSTLSRIDQLMRDQERQYMTLPPLQNPAVNNVKQQQSQPQRDYSFVGGSGSSTYDYAGSTEPLPTNAAIRKKQDSFTAYSALFTVFSLLTYSLDLASDAFICYLFYINHNLICAGITLAFTVTPSVIVNVFSVRWYVQDDKESSKAMKDSTGLEDTPMLHRPKMSLCDWLVRVVFHLLLLGPVVRYLELLVYGVKSRRQARQRGEQWPYAAVNRIEQPKERQVDYYLLMIHEDRDTALLSLFKAVLQSAPQATLQIFLLASEFSLKGHIANELIGGCQLASAMSSLVSIALSLSSYHRALRRSVPDKYNMSRVGAILQFIWRLCTVGSRIICIALFTSEYTFWLIPLCVGHWGVMSVWVMHQGTRFCDTESGQPRQCEEYLFDMLIGAIYLVCFLNVKDEPTRYKYTGYYVITCIENVATIVLWYFRAGSHVWFRLPVLVGTPCLFAFGILIMAVYYRYYHPNGMLPIYNPIARCC
ncbi:XK-related protein 4-like isoform X2 [Varroa destructor]|uniref:XK-related protein n=1 Tax=Varroa destructor TaxID=109461 RepID=A0A7M7JVZ7_VARDE|nr:XK-related protein 4-like isoform X2 [Varroa destructor]